MHMQLHVQLGYALIPTSEYGKDCCCPYHHADKSVVALMNWDEPDTTRWRSSAVRRQGVQKKEDGILLRLFSSKSLKHFNWRNSVVTFIKVV